MQFQDEYLWLRFRPHRSHSTYIQRHWFNSSLLDFDARMVDTQIEAGEAFIEATPEIIYVGVNR